VIKVVAFDVSAAFAGVIVTVPPVAESSAASGVPSPSNVLPFTVDYVFNVASLLSATVTVTT
jgi:hypothetical protein